MKTIIKYQLMYFLKDQYSKNLTEVTFAKNAEGLSGMDKMEMNLSKIDEGQVILAEVNVKREIDRILKRYDFDISEDEINYYIKNHKPCKLQAQLVYSYWGKEFGSYRNSNLVSRREYVKLLLVMKKRLLLQAGCKSTEEFTMVTKLPYLLTGNVKDRINTRVIRNNKFVSKVTGAYLFKYLHDKKYKELFQIKPEYVIGLLSQLINTTFTYVTYEHQDITGTDIEYDENRISDELLLFFSNL